jgi:hypothetical protein
MIHVVKNNKTGREYIIDGDILKSLDMKRKYKLIDSYDENKKQKAIIPEEIIIKQTNKKLSKND